MTWENGVIGGGPAGAALAMQLARAGREVTLIERETGPTDKVCGEFLSWESVNYLRELGLDLRALGAVTLRTLAVIGPSHGGRTRMASVELPFRALSLSRRVLDEALLGQAMEAGVRVQRGLSVRVIERAGSAFHAFTEQDEPIRARALFLASGKHDVYSHPRGPGRQSDLIAFKMHYQLEASQRHALHRRVEFMPFPGGYAGLQPIEHGYANLCLVVQRETYRQLGQHWEALIEQLGRQREHLQLRLAGAQPCWDRPLELAHIPYGFMQRVAHDGLWRLGDQAAVIPSFAGDGIAVALHSARLAASQCLKGRSAEGYQAHLCEQLSHHVRVATLLSRLLVHRFAQKALIAVAYWVPQFLRALALEARLPAQSSMGPLDRPTGVKQAG